jgi:hypothetical protein
MKKQNRKNAVALLGAVAATMSGINALATTFVDTASQVQQGTSDGTVGNGGDSGNDALNNPAITISFSGQTALVNFDESPGITELAPGTSIVLHDGPADVNNGEVTYTANSATGSYVQLANPNFAGGDTNPGTPTSPSTATVQIASAIALEWHEEGSVDGFYDLINDQIGYAGGSPTNVGTPISNESLRVPSTANPTFINTASFSTSGSQTINGFTLSSSTADVLADTYNSNVYTQATGNNIAGGQNRVQFSVGEYPTEAFAVSGTASPFASAGSPGYGQGNTALAAGTLKTALGQAGADEQFQPTSIANEATTTVDPQTDSNYAAGPWNTAGANNITSIPFAVTAVTYSANPGTGLERLNQSDTQWLQTTGRLENGALFNVVARTVDTGQRVVFALNTGIDPSWAVGSNDDGNSTSSASANAQHSLGSSFRFDGKTSGSEAETTISQSRMGIGALSISEAQKAKATAPIRALDIGFNYTSDSSIDPGDTADPTISSYGSDNSDSNPEFVRANASTIESSNSATRYAATLISHYNTVKAPSVTALNAELALIYGAGSNINNTSSAQQQNAWAAVQSFDPSTAETGGTPSFPVSGIKGDDVGFNSGTGAYDSSSGTGDVAAFLSNIINSVGTADGASTTTALNPADSLFANGYLIPSLLDYTRQTDGGAITPVTLSPSELAYQSQVNSTYGSLLTTDNTNASNNQTDGSSAVYGAANSGTPTINTAIPVTAKDVTTNGSGGITGWSTASNKDLTAAGGNYLFGNFNQNGVRDLSAVQQSVNAALSLFAVDSTYAGGGSNSIYTGAPNNTVIPSLDNTTFGGAPSWVSTATNEKGDLVVLGDYNSDGEFNGQDVYLLAIGASLTSADSTTGLNATATTFADAVRDPTDILRKNYALNWINTYLNNVAGGTQPGVTANPTGVAWLRQTGAAVLTGYNPATTNVATGTNPVTGQENYIPTGATDLHTTDPITGLEQYTYDPTGANAFNPSDVNRDGTVDFNDAVLVDQYNGQSYENLTQSLAATAQTPVTGVTEPISLAVVQQVDGESAIGAADLAVVNTALTGVGNTNWYAYNVQKTGPGTITWARTGGTVTVYSGAKFEVSNGVVQIGGTQDPFTDNTGGATNGNHVAVTVDGGAKLQITQSFSTLTVSALNINTLTNSSVDIGTNALIIDYGNGPDPIASIEQWIKDGYAGGSWDGPGITSSAIAGADAGTGLSYGIGYADYADPGNPANLSFGEIEVKYTLLGDANLDGTVNAEDYTPFSQNIGLSGTVWDQGDFNYDGTVNSEDYTLFAHNIGQSADQAGPLEVASNSISLTNVPEPSGPGLALIVAAGVLYRRTRTRPVPASRLNG